MVDRPLKKITEGLNKITNGDFSVQIPNISEITDTGRFNIIIDHINKMTAELSGIETLRNDFIANVSHELKTPLAVINNYGTLLQSPDLSEEERLEYAKAVTENSRRLANLIANILKLNKLENQQIYPKSEKYDLSEQICECLLDFEFAWEQKNLEIDTDIDEDIFINADSELLSLVWNNLFSNAVKFTDNGGKIFVGLKKNSDFAIVTVTDTGCGMSAETGRHIFEKFYQGDTSHAGKGNGLGLALVKRVVDIINGEISVQSEIGKGSTFIVKLRCGNEKV
ncbi:MAG: HAMP domain-containing histidine kinase [Alistipes sp.]|nr:HAMP domain-containing histidine kinase [Alistipes sp.]